MVDGTPYRVVRISQLLFDTLVLEDVIKPGDFELVKYGVKNEKYDDDRWKKAFDKYIKAKTELENENYRCREAGFQRTSES